MTQKYICVYTGKELDLELGYCPNCERTDCALMTDVIELVA